MTPSIRQRVRRPTLASAALAVAAFLGTVHAGDATDVDRPTVPTGLEYRIFDVSGLVAGWPEFHMESAPPRPTYGVADPNGREGAERRPSFGSIDDVVAFVRSIDPAAFEAERGVRLGALGSRHMSLRAPSEFHLRVAAGLAELERRALPVTTLDVVALRGEASWAAGHDLASSIARGALVPLSGARSSGVGGRITARAGRERSYLAAVDATVAISAGALDPTVRIARDGVAFEAAIDFVTPERVVTTLSAWWADIGAPRRVDTASLGDGIESITTETRRFEGVVELVPGVWKLLPSSGDVRFAVRATVHPHDLPIPTVPPLCSCDPVADTGPVARRVHRTIHLHARSFGQSLPSGILHLWASNATPDEPPPGREDVGAFPADELVEAIRTHSDPDHWFREGRLDLANGHLWVVADEAHDRAVGALLDAIRTQFLRTIDVRATVVTLPLVSLPEYWSGLGDGSSILAGGGRALSARPGARVVDRGAVHARPGQRDASVGGTARRYVADYDVEIAERAVIGNPTVRAVLDGLAFEVEVDSVAGGTAVLCTVRFHRGVWRGSRRVSTSHGDIECPTLGVSAVHGEVVIPLGSSRLVGAALEGETVTLTLVEVTDK